MSRLLMIDDDEKLVALTREYLESHGFEVVAAHDGHAGVEAVRATEPALVILDLMLPGIDGLEVCRRLRQWSRVPILILTAKGDETERVVGLEMGADDYLSKPFNARELLARIRAILRRSDDDEKAAGASVVRVGPLVVDLGSRAVSVRGQQVDMNTAGARRKLGGLRPLRRCARQPHPSEDRKGSAAACTAQDGAWGRLPTRPSRIIVKSFLLAAKIATVFLLVMATFVSVTLHLFSRTVDSHFPDGVSPTDAHTSFVVAVLWRWDAALTPWRSVCVQWSWDRRS